ncbi:hexose kinase [Nocardioides sp. InS609-2]|uniref:1-phosphofructokinase family hexose kinase n=1 Tax=Nocardioides sp. InS609-2 TaxID=2760705 RepID=UPI0020BD86EA|nr:hexose kinase [Nocardioides sp. InS609-2]
MIVTVTANPAYDVTYELPSLTPGDVHRVETVHQRPGGKGVNVAAVLTQLGEPVIATGLSSVAFAADLAALGVNESFVTALPHVRRTLAVVEPGRTTSLWEPGAAVPEGAGARLRAHVDTLLVGATCLVLSGSLPPGLPPTTYADLATRAVRRGVPVLVDTSGPALLAAAQVPGVVLMPNVDELAELSGGSADLVAASRRLVDSGVGAVIATRGAEGLVVTTIAGSWAAVPPEPVAGNPTGAGDAAAAAVARGLATGTPPEDLAADAVVVSAAAVASPVAGAVDEHLMRAWQGRVVVTPLVPITERA